MDEMRKNRRNSLLYWRPVSWRLGTLAGIGMLWLAGCTHAGLADGAEPGAALQAVLPGGTGEMSVFGEILAGRVAQDNQDYAAALKFYRSALSRDPGNADLANRVVALSVAEGRFDIAQPIAAKLVVTDPEGAGLAALVETVEQVKAGHFKAALTAADHLPKEGFYRLAGTFARAWSAAGLPDKAKDAVGEFDEFAHNAPLAPLKALQTALVQDLIGDASGAATNYREALGKGEGTPLRMVELAGNFFERHGQAEEAGQLYSQFTTETGGVSGVEPHLSAGGVPAPIVGNPRQGLAEAMFDMASVVGQADSPEVALLSVRLALELEPNFPVAQLVLADVFETLHRYPEALAAYRAVDRKAPLAWTARLHEATLLDRTGDTAGAAAQLAAMAAERPQRPEPLIELGDIERAHSDFTKAVDTYSAALDRIGADLPSRDWSVLFDRAIAEERSGAWDKAEPDLRHTIALRPNEPAVLNYLGYAMVDRNEHIPEALKLIKQAVDLRPGDGFILDSLGWAYYRMGDFKTAQNTLERAVELEPADAEITGHLADVYYQAGRREEARQQWQRALDLNPSDDLAKAIKAKLDHPPKLQKQHANGG
jgi:tetratricopeptide (TPR) repeat protein